MQPRRATMPTAEKARRRAGIMKRSWTNVRGWRAPADEGGPSTASSNTAAPDRAIPRLAQRSAVLAGFLSLVIAAPAAGFDGYVTNSGDATVSVIETTTDEVVGSPIAVGALPLGIAVRPQEDRVYVATALGGAAGTVTVIDTSTKTAITQVAQTEGPAGVAVHTAGTTVYVANGAANSVNRINTADNTALSSISVTAQAPAPVSVAATAPGLAPFVFVAGDSAFPLDGVAAIDGTDTVVDSITVGDGARAIALTPDGTKAYVANFDDGTVSVLDVSTPSSMGLLTTIAVGGGPSGIAIPATGGKAYVTNSNDDTVSVIDTTADTSNPLADIALDPASSPSAAAATPDSARVYVTNEGNNDVSIIDTATDSRIGPDISVGTAPRGIVLFGSGALPPPILGEQANVDPIKGKVKTKCKGDEKFTLLLGAEQIPIGCQIDTRKGRVELTTATGIGEETQTAVFWAGRFRVEQSQGGADAGTAAKAKAIPTVLSLVGALRSSKSSARDAGEPSANAAKKRKKRKLWGKGKGTYKTKGKKGAGSVRGTTWLTEDRSDDSTRLKVKAGKVRFRDFVKRRTVKLTAGESYVAKK